MSKPSKPATSDDNPTPWIKWSGYPSTDRDTPDFLEIKVVETAPFETKYGKAVKVLLKKGVQWLPYSLTLKAKESNNAKLEYLWTTNTQNGRIHPGTEFILKTWKRKSMTSEWMIRDFEMVFKEEEEAVTASSSSTATSRKSSSKGDVL